MTSTKKSVACLSIKICASTKAKSVSTSSIRCSICFDDFKNDAQANQSIVATPCGHIYHQECLTKWSEQSHRSSNNCPDCRFPFRIEQTKRVYFNFSSEGNNAIEMELNELAKQINARDVELNRLQMEKKSIKKSFSALDEKCVELENKLAEQRKDRVNLLERAVVETATVKRQIDYVDGKLDRILNDCNQMEIEMKIIEGRLEACDLNEFSTKLGEIKKLSADRN